MTDFDKVRPATGRTLWGFTDAADDRIQNWAADRGHGQYALPRSKPRATRVDNVGLRLVVGSLGLFFTILFGAIVLIMSVFGGAFIFGALLGG